MTTGIAVSCDNAVVGMSVDKVESSLLSQRQVYGNEAGRIIVA